MALKYFPIDQKKEIYEVEISLKDLALARKEIELSIGYSALAAPEHFSEIIDSVIRQVPGKCEIRAGYRLIDLQKAVDRDYGFYVGGNLLNTDKIIFASLKKAERAALFAVTIGQGMELWSAELFRQGEILMGYLVDAAASVLVESVADLLHDHIESRMLELGLKITNRYSPGYCNWDVSEQHILFSLLPEKFCGITLTDSALMLPVKSVSGIIGIGKNVKYSKYSCDSCGVKDCTYRPHRVPEKKLKTLT